MQSSWEITWFPSLPNVRMLCLDPVQKLNTELLPMQWLRCPGCANSWQSCMRPSVAPLWFNVIISAQFICLPTLSSVNAPSMWKLIFTSFGSVLPLELFVLHMFLPALSTPISSPRACHRRSLLIFGPASTSRLPTFRLRGGVRQIDCLSCVYWAWAVSRLGPWAAHPSLLDDREGNLVGSCFYKP